MKIKLKVPKPVCRTPIKPVQKHKTDKDYVRKPKHPLKDKHVS